MWDTNLSRPVIAQTNSYQRQFEGIIRLVRGWGEEGGWKIQLVRETNTLGADEISGQRR